MSVSPFQLYVWPERLLMLAPAYASGRHRHHAAQIALGLDGPVTFVSPGCGERCADLLLIPPDVAHGHPAFGASATLFLEPQGAEWASFASYAEGGLAALPFDPALRADARRAATGDVVAAQTLVNALLGPRTGREPNDDALVASACDFIRRHLDGPITLAMLAKAVHRSPSRVAHRFRESTGVPLRRYVLWCRLRAAVETAMRGASLTDAAHGSGFADSAHLSRTFRAMFGVAPSFLFGPGRASVTFVDTAQGG